MKTSTSTFSATFALGVGIAATTVAGCGNATTSRGAAEIPAVLQQRLAGPEVAQRGKGAQWVQFDPKTNGFGYSAIVTGPDRNIWFIDEVGRGLVRMTETGAIKEFDLGGVFHGNPVSMTVGADGRFYIGDEFTSIVRATTAGATVTIPIPSGDSTSIDGMAPGPDGNVWFGEFDHIAKITPAGKITEFPYPAGYSPNQYGGVTTGSDGNVWFAASTGNAIGRIVPSSGAITMFPIPVACIPAPLVLADDGNLWFACLTSTPLLGRITPSGAISTYPIGGTFDSNETEQFCRRGPDGQPWCASGDDNTVFRVNTATQTVTTFNPPLGEGQRPDAVTTGPDGNLWVDMAAGFTSGKIDVLVLDPLSVKPASVSFSAIGQQKTLTVSETGSTHWTAVSSNTAVATVASGGSNDEFTVTAAGAGSCKITISDGLGNSVAVTVTVT